MPFISRTRYEELLALEAGEASDSVQKAHELDSRRASRRHRQEIETIIEDHAEDMSKLRAQHRTKVLELEGKLEDAKTDVQKAKKVADTAANEKIEKALEDQKAANKKIEAALAERDSKLTLAENNVKTREGLVAARETAVEKAEKDFAGKVAAHAKEIADARADGDATGEKRGYANGIADGLRNVSDLTKDANDKVSALANKAQDALVSAATRAVPAPAVNVLSVPTIAPQAAQNKQK